MSPDYNVPSNTPMAVRGDAGVSVSGGAGYVEVSGNGFTVSLSGDGSPLRAGETYRGGVEIVVGGYVMSRGGGKFKVHELELDAAGKVKRAVLSWVKAQETSLGSIGLCPGYVVYQG
jgi:hypothetical protein